ncbi:MAG: ABC transporter ATP-binding protein [Alphaproteobacteria bacterium]|nr:ABC transporter ATP-binding protein [Alphaproteobacteria bacterium]MBU0795700.1 ABC transporter ATP-binding protein [Alphaproteobacteria bacterium]MBU0887323.1 ABC transporter ATP-binding protein [Alphaproteobacteria bacterium]MBU1811796.1 ABC transporter ATP-binding protein [Alphaproteobacteria bacterium]MBU2091087.1 ABC transporter ATP-binding protein [Alphaproteobacteria bacterium]
MGKLEISGVSRLFAGAKGGDVQALKPIDFTVADGEFVALLGPSGCGKSTLLRLVAGLDAPSTGSIALDGRPVTGPSPERGMVFQQPALYPWLTVRDNVGFGLIEQGASTAESRAAAEELLAQVGLGDFAAQFPKALSGGMQQRVALARALAPNPEVLLLDEPFGALDTQTRGLMQELLLDVWERHRKTVLFVTHDIEEAIFLASRIIVMTARPGRIKADVPVPLPRPRDYHLRTAPEFYALRAELTDLVRDETLRAAAFT